MNSLYNFYDKLFLYYYNIKKNDDDTPQYFPIIIISAAQSANIFLIVILIFYLLKIEFSSLPKFYLIFAIGTHIFNFYLYQIKNRKEIILTKNIKIPLVFKILSYFYFLASYASPLLLIYFINEYLK